MDNSRRGYFDLKDFALLIKQIVDSWVNVTNINTDNTLIERVDEYVMTAFEEMDVRRLNLVYLEDFLDAMDRNPELLNVFDFLKKGQRYQRQDHQLSVVRNIELIEQRISKIVGHLRGDSRQVSATQPLSGEIHENANTSFTGRVEEPKLWSSQHTQEPKLTLRTPRDLNLTFCSPREVNHRSAPPPPEKRIRGVVIGSLVFGIAFAI